MKLRNPKGGGMVAVPQGNFIPDMHGVYDVPDAVGQTLKAEHGFVDHDAAQPHPAAAAAPPAPSGAKAPAAPVDEPWPEGSVIPPRSDLIAFLKMRGIATPVTMSNDKLARLVRANVFVPPSVGGVRSDPADDAAAAAAAAPGGAAPAGAADAEVTAATGPAGQQGA